MFAQEADPLLRDLELVRQIDCEIAERLPFFYNNTGVGGYLNMPSARMNEEGTISLGLVSLPPYTLLNLNFQMFSHIEFSGNYRIFNGILDGNFGKQGFGNQADRQANVKFAFLRPSENFPFLPSFAMGWNDFFGSRDFNSFYFVGTKEWKEYNAELTVGWGKGRISGFFGGAAWTPFRKLGLSLVAEYDPINYEDDPSPKGRSQKYPINFGLIYTPIPLLQLQVSQVRGEKLAASASLNYNFGSSNGLYPKIDNAPIYKGPVDVHPLDQLRPGRLFASELAFALLEQGLYLTKVYLQCEEKRALWLRVINTRYREEGDFRSRVENVLARLIPENVDEAIVVLEADGVQAQQYTYREQDLEKFREERMDEFELEVLSPRAEVESPPNSYDAIALFRRKKPIVTLTVRPRAITFFGSTSGKLKATFGVVAGPEGYLFDSLYYKMQVATNLYTSLSDVGDRDFLNPSKLPVVRSDKVRYYDSTISLEQAYLQKSFNMGGGTFSRLATGYFEPMYGGVAGEFLYYPVNSDWAVGLEGAVVVKRKTDGLGFTTDVRNYDGTFIGTQGFLNLYYDFRPLHLSFAINAGQFLAKDWGARFSLTKTYRSGLQFSLWYTFTNGGDRVNHKNYYDKGIAFFIPLDLFLQKSSRSYVGYAMAAWLRDVGAQSRTGKPLYRTINGERLRY